jgi:hypothetical protein
MQTVIISSKPCPTASFMEIWRPDVRQSANNTLYIVREYEVPGCGVNPLSDLIDLSYFIDHLSTKELINILSEILLHPATDLMVAFKATILNSEFTENLITAFEQCSGQHWSEIADDLEFRHHRQAPSSTVVPYAHFWDTFGIHAYPDFIHVGLQLRSSELRKVKYLPLSDVRDPEIYDYARCRTTTAEAIEYARIGLQLEANSTLIVNPALQGLSRESTYQFVIDALKLALLQMSNKVSKLFHRYKDSQVVTNRMYQLMDVYPREMAYIAKVYEVVLPTAPPLLKHRVVINQLRTMISVPKTTWTDFAVKARHQLVSNSELVTAMLTSRRYQGHPDSLAQPWSFETQPETLDRMLYSIWAT